MPNFDTLETPQILSVKDLASLYLILKSNNYERKQSHESSKVTK